MARENFTYADFTEGYRAQTLEEVVVDGYARAQKGSLEALGYAYSNLDYTLSPVEEANCTYLMQRASQMLFGLVGFLGEEPHGTWLAAALRCGISAIIAGLSSSRLPR